MLRFSLIATAVLCAAPLAMADIPACGPELDRATAEARTNEARLSWVAREAYEMIGWISMDYEEGIINAQEESRLLMEAEDKRRAAKAEHAAAEDRLAALRKKYIECGAAEP